MFEIVIVLDLDDTLYDEREFVRGGFKKVANYLERCYSINSGESIQFMDDKLKSNGRGHIFDALLTNYGFYSKKNVEKCISVYHTHKPKIYLYPDAEDFLRRFRSYPLYIVTDGNKIVQKNKISALGLYEKVKACYITHCYGIKKAKPSPYCFLRICRKEKTEPQKVICIGDNPDKDFVGIKPLGFKTIRILRGPYKNVFKSKEFEAEYQFNFLSDINEKFLKYIIKNV